MGLSIIRWDGRINLRFATGHVVLSGLTAMLTMGAARGGGEDSARCSTDDGNSRPRRTRPFVKARKDGQPEDLRRITWDIWKGLASALG